MPFRVRIYLLLIFSAYSWRQIKIVGEATVCTFSANQTYEFLIHSRLVDDNSCTTATTPPLPRSSPQ